jgi:ATP-dependent Lhr-like helicase
VALQLFTKQTRSWFTSAFAEPTPAQLGAWEAIATGGHALVIAPTGSGKTLSAFLSALDDLVRVAPPQDPGQRCRVVYVSPLKALAVDVERNLRSPLAGIGAACDRLGLPRPDITVGIRSGDTSPEERRQLARRPPDILITTPESLFLMLTSKARESLVGVRTVILDEVHAVAATKRGAHLSLTLERLDELLARPAQRIGLSATVRPEEEVARWLGGGREVTVVRPPSTKVIDVSIEVPVPDMTDLGGDGPPAPGASAAAPPVRASLWPAIEARVLDHVMQHRSTLVFTNSRRTAERLTANVNELANERAGGAVVAHGVPAQVMGQAGTGLPADGTVEVARAHHGSVSREQRNETEEMLKSGRLPAVVATSSLELGIDMGAVDLVVQIGAPPSVASGLQRVGRAGHQVGAVSSGVLLPRHRHDLLPSVVVATRMRAALIESMTVPRNPLDVLAQQIVAMVAMQDWSVADLAALVRRCASYSALPDTALTAVLDMLSGRYPSDEFAELRPRIVWDRETDVLSGRPGAQRLAVTSGGTIPDRGMFGVFLAGAEGPGRRVGELDEEMVYESRVGDAFLLGSSTWRIEQITHDRVLVTPAPGMPGRMPFWKGDALGRPVELGRAIGAYVREVAALAPPALLERLRADGLDPWAADNLVALIAEQRAACGRLADDRTIVVERFTDELGDWRLAIHSPFGAQVNTPWGLALAARLREVYGLEAAVMPSDDGIVLRLPETDADPPGAELILFEPDEIEDLVTAEVGGSALFASRFRECAGRALLLPRRNPGRRSPLWQQRQRSAHLLQITAQYASFPIVLETMREVLQDVFDVPGLTGLMREIRDRTVRVVEVATDQPSPAAQGLLFNYLGAFMYEGDAPLAERRAAALALDASLLAELLGHTDVADLLDPVAVAEVEAELQWLSEDRHARDAEAVADLLRRVGDLTVAEGLQRGARTEWFTDLQAQRRATQVRIAGEQRWIAVEDAGRVRDALGVALPTGVAEAFTEPVRDPLGDIVARYARTHGPFEAGAVATRFGLGVAVVLAALQRLAGQARVVRAGEQPETWCDSEVLRRLRRRSLAKLRAEVEPVPAETLAAFTLQWQGVGAAAGRGQDALLRAVEQLSGAIVPASALESLVLPARVRGYEPAMLDELMAAGEVLWAGAGGLAGGDGWISLAPAEDAAVVLPAALAVPESPVHTAVLDCLAGGGGLFFRQLCRPELDDAQVLAAVWDLVWAGLVTNDTLAPLRATLGSRGAHKAAARSVPRARGARFGRTSTPLRQGPPGSVGRWSLVVGREGDATRRAHAQALLQLERYGVLTRGAVVAEGATFARTYRVLAALEDTGRCRRGYFVAGLGAAQFAVSGAVDRLRAVARAQEDGPVAEPGWAVPGARSSEQHEPGQTVVLAATDPASPFGAALPFPPHGGTHRPARKAGAVVVLVDGRLVLWVERGGRTVLSWGTALDQAAEALAAAATAGALGRIQVEKADGESIVSSPLGDALQRSGFRLTPKGLRAGR